MLKKANILITRPIPQGRSLHTALKALGAHPIECPTIAIRSLPKAIPKSDIVIFVSKNAVECAYKANQALAKTLASAAVFAIGVGTACALNVVGCEEVIIPNSLPYGSGSLLELESLQEVSGKTVVIVNGVHGKELLAHTLTQRGARVRTVAVYTSEPPKQLSHMLHAICLQHTVSAIVTTSLQGLSNLIESSSSAVKTVILTIPLIVVGARSALCAQEAGFKTVLLAQGADDEAILEALHSIPISLEAVSS